MNLQALLAKHFREVHYGGNWTYSNLKDTLKDVNWQQATTKLSSLNTIAMLVFHINYYVVAISNVMRGENINASDKYSFDVPPIQSEEEWQKLVEKLFTDADNLAVLIEALPEGKLRETFAHEKYGDYYRNIQGVIEHTHYHLGQIVVIKKLILEKGGS